ncbi:hypothetical protein HOK51_06790 [Candidatus Woesearchaeota archaeon]|jgi:hypothetical protein|nr:hypothetical protein [Candidatus Woesearchaeota archaeon]MBT6519529.1 hypothetical protein [Candidatus Woesearchaeota archaeon]MBT7367726.1 hypothetical protein [Candidatus Woesearchaeota archaeon]
MKKNYKLNVHKSCILISLLIILILITGCRTIYVCPNGKQTKDESTCKKQLVCPDGLIRSSEQYCKFNKELTIDHRDAEKMADIYVNAYTSLSGIKARLINSYITSKDIDLNETGGDYIVNLVVQEPDAPYETTLQIDGATAEVSCIKNCQYTK